MNAAMVPHFDRWSNIFQLNYSRPGSGDRVAPTGKDVIGHGMRLFRIDVLGHDLWCREPTRRGGFTNVRVLGGAKEGAEIDGELMAMAIVVGDGFGAEFVDYPVDFEGVENFGGVEESVDHGPASAGCAV